MTAPFLEVEGVAFSYGPIQVLFDVGLTVGEGERVGLLGTNGAGKSTLLAVISGLRRPSRGAVRLRGEDITRLDPGERVQRGLMQISGGRAMFATLPVEDNIRLGAFATGAGRAEVDRRLAEALDVFPGLRAKLAQPAGTLSGGEQQMVALSRALVSGAQLLLVDELSLGLAPVVMAEVLKMVEELTRRGTTLVLVEQSVNVAMSLTERAYFMERGRMRFEGPSSELIERRDLVRAVFFGDGGGEA